MIVFINGVRRLVLERSNVTYHQYIGSSVRLTEIDVAASLRFFEYSHPKLSHGIGALVRLVGHSLNLMPVKWWRLLVWHIRGTNLPLQNPS